MRLLNFWSKKKEPAKPSSVSSSSSMKKEEPISHNPIPREANTIKPTIKVTITPDIEVTTKTSVESIRITDKVGLEKNIQLETQPQKVEMVFFCPIRNARIYCHSVLIDKLGDLTKFIISSIHEGHTIEEISALTRMGNTTVEEELEYLINGGLIDDDRQTLTELGNQYGILLEKFSDLAEGVSAAFNVFSGEFETIEEEKYVKDPDPKHILEGLFIPALTRNDNFANSLVFAKSQIESDTPFCWEIENSLYATVKIDRKESKYKPVYIRDFSRGYYSENYPCVKVAIPCDEVTYKPRYKWLNEYREVITQIFRINEKYSDLLSDKAKLIINAAKEESDAEILKVDINTITGLPISYKDDLCELPEDSSVYVLERQPARFLLNEKNCEGLYLEEINRESLYQIRYFTYENMEV